MLKSNKVKIEYFGFTDVGSSRDQNEDSFMCLNRLYVDIASGGMKRPAVATLSEDPIVFAVADGMGGHDAGEIASRLTLEKLRKKLYHRFAESRQKKALIESSLKEIHMEINEYARLTGKKNMGTTLCGCVITSEYFFAFNAGDSRLSRYRDGKITQVTKDHSLNAISSNTKMPANIILSCIGGGKSKITIDIYNLTRRTKDDDLYILCTDGLIDSLSNNDIIDVIERESGSLKKIASGLVHYAIGKGSHDNVTCILFKIIAR